MKSIINIKNVPITYDYIRGLVEGEGCFTFCSVTQGNGIHYYRHLIPTFMLRMSQQDENLMHLVSNKLCLKNDVLIFKKLYKKDGYNRQQMLSIMVRHPGELRNIIIPLFYKKLVGNKGIQFENWIYRIGEDPLVPHRYKFLYFMYKNGSFDKNMQFDY